MSKVSILVPVYGVEKFIERCAISLFEQTFADIEFIFVNDCTPDNSIEILGKTIEKYPHRKSQVQIINHEVNKGLAGARNTGVEHASGDYILHVDSDDYLDLNAIELLYAKAVETNSDIVTCNYVLQWGEIQHEAVQNIGKDKVDFINLMLSSQAIVGVVNKLFRRKLYIDNNIKAFEGVNFGEDYVTSPRLAYYANSVSKIDNPVYHYIQTNTNSYTKKLTKGHIDNILFVFEELTNFFGNKEDYHLYKKAILEGKLRKKIELFFITDSKYWNDLYLAFPEVKQINDLSILTVRENIIYKLIENRNFLLLKLYKRSYNFAVYIYQKLKGRL
ncbi:glycosyltransferase family 2 protein [Empedobacter sp.]|uniref:glycosyltransferase family 2 protein n=1 Tax=Empedobacter sp. TaxID=1927715 RepID=UPI0028A81353|nr:glycosyltransferase family 2 protein [Empedobacter sp.]